MLRGPYPNHLHARLHPLDLPKLACCVGFLICSSPLRGRIQTLRLVVIVSAEEGHRYWAHYDLVWKK